jgi:phospholipid/cholesterol/gamma-HCH transport system substrate-binding protein
MQITKKQKRRVAFFFLIGVIVFAGTVAVLVGNKLLKKENCYYTTFKELSVSGLSQGSSVKFQGMDVGQVRRISIDKIDTTVVRIDVCIKPDVSIKDGTYANLGSLGITGLKFVELKGGGMGKDIPIEGLIPGQKSGLDDITQKASEITNKIDRILEKTDKMLSKLDDDSLNQVVKNVQSITDNINGIIQENRGEIKAILTESTSIFSNVNRAIGNVNTILIDLKTLSIMIKKMTKPSGTVDSIMESFKELSGKLAKTDVGNTIDKVNKLVDSMYKTTEIVTLTMLRSKEAIVNSVDDLSEGMEYFKEFTRIIMENPGAILRSNEE